MKNILPAILTSMIIRESQMVDAAMTPPSATESSPERTVKMAMIGIISKTESSRLKRKDAIKEFLSLPEKSNSLLII